MRAAAKFTQSRLYRRPRRARPTTSRRSTRPSTASCPPGCWTTTAARRRCPRPCRSATARSPRAPPNTQTTHRPGRRLHEHARRTPVAIANTACIIFNSRGIPVDDIAPAARPDDDAVYIDRRHVVYGITVAATGFIRTWRANYTATPTMEAAVMRAGRASTARRISRWWSRARILVTLMAGLMSLAGLAISTTENQGHLAARTTEYAQDKMEQLWRWPTATRVSDTRVFPAAQHRRHRPRRRRQLQRPSRRSRCTSTISIRTATCAARRRAAVCRAGRHDAADRLVLQARVVGRRQRHARWQSEADHGRGHDRARLRRRRQGGVVRSPSSRRIRSSHDAPARRQAGFSLLELMVAMAIMLLISGAAVDRAAAR